MITVKSQEEEEPDNLTKEDKFIEEQEARLQQRKVERDRELTELRERINGNINVLRQRIGDEQSKIGNEEVTLALEAYAGKAEEVDIWKKAYDHERKERCEIQKILEDYFRPGRKEKKKKS